jgi:2-methylcitrate dehydratase PrpD
VASQAVDMGEATPDVVDWVSSVAFDDLPAPVVRAARRCLLDLIGVAAAGIATANARILREHVARHYGPGERGARMLFDGRRVSLPGAAMAGATTIDSFDAHDGHKLTKGHVGVVVLPALLVFTDEVARSDGPEFLTRFVIGYEIGTRAGIALHASVPDYHTSGAWNALAAAAIGARALGLDRERTRHALGAAEYYGPRSQMMRCIDHPTMVKDGATYGAQVGVTAVLLAADGFTGAPAVTVEDAGVAALWTDFGRRWRITEQYLKAYPVCRWAQPPVEAARSLLPAIAGRSIGALRIVTFHESKRLVNVMPATTEEAQYAVAFPVAAMLLRGRLDSWTVTGELADAELGALVARTELVESEAYNARFPAERWAHVAVVLEDGTVLNSEPHQARGDPEAPLSDGEVEAKFEALAGPVLGPRRASAIETLVAGLPATAPAELLDAILAPTQTT